jgi:hypothetical protein
VGLRAILRLVGKEGFSNTVTVGYAGGSFILRQVFDVKLGALANLDHEAFLRVEIEGEEICSVIWPLKPSQRLKDVGLDIRVPSHDWHSDRRQVPDGRDRDGPAR